MKPGWWAAWRLAAGVAALLLTFGACTGAPSTSPRPTERPTIPPGTSAPPSPSPRLGGSLTFGAEQWPECLNPLTNCASDWANYTVFQHVLPRAMELDPGGNYVASPLLVEAPTLENGGLDPGPPFRIRFRIRDEAVWNDGSPITSADFAFTWRAILHTPRFVPGVLHGPEPVRSDPYGRIETVDASLLNEVVLTLAEPWAGWPELFGGRYGFVLKRAAFPEMAEAAKPDLQREMKDEIPFSGGPFLLRRWSQDGAVLVRNENYYGRPANLDEVAFRPITDQAIEFATILDRKISAIYPATADVSLLDSAGIQPDMVQLGGPGPLFEALWLNASQPPLDEPAVRQALLYAFDRRTVVDQLIRLNDPSAEPLGCGFVALPRIGPWCATRPFGAFQYDPAFARSLLEAAGYDCSPVPCRKDGRALTIRYSTVQTNTRRTTTAELMIDKALEAGVHLTMVNCDCGVLFSDIGPRGEFELADYAVPVPPDGSILHSFGCEAIPTAANEYTGRNWIHWCNPEADRLMMEADRELDPTRRLELLQRVYELQAQDAIGLPLYAIPAVSIWLGDDVAGPIGAYNGHPYGLFFNMNEWYLP